VEKQSAIWQLDNVFWFPVYMYMYETFLM